MSNNNQEKPRVESIVLFDETTSELDEDLLLNSNCQSNIYKRALLLMDLYLSFFNLNIDNSPGHTNYERTNLYSKSHRKKDSFVFLKTDVDCSASRPHRKLCKSSRVIEIIFLNRYFQLTCMIILHYFIIKFFLLTVFQYRLDVALKRWQPTVRRNATRTDKCALIDDLIYTDDTREALEVMIQSRKWLDFLSNPFSSVTGACAIMMNTLFLYPLFLITALRIFSQHYQVRIDFLCFMVDPEGECQYIHRILDHIVSTVIDSLKTYESNQDIRQIMSNRNEPIPLSTLERIADNPNLTFIKRNVQSNAAQTRSINSNCHPSNMSNGITFNASCQQKKKSLTNKEDLQFIRLLLDIRCSNLVRPSNMCANWHKILLKLVFYGLFLFTIINLSFGFVVCTLISIGEFLLRASHRIGLSECKNWMPNGTLIRLEQIQLDELVSADQEAYRVYGGSFMNLLYLSVTIESKHLFGSTRRLITWIEVYMNLAGIMIWFTFFVYIYLIGIVDRVKWAEQIEKQVASCVQQFSKHQYNNSNQQATDQGADQELVRNSLISYLNYSLFKNRHKNFQFTNNCLVGQMTCLIVGTMIMAYLVATFVDSQFTVVLLFSISYVISFVNLYLMSSAYLYGKVVKIMNNINRLLAYGTSLGSRNLAFSMEMWRRQLLNDKELTRFYAFNSFGASIAFDKLITVNAYLIALWLIFYRF